MELNFDSESCVVFCLSLSLSRFIFGCPMAHGVARSGIRFELQLQPKLQRCWIPNSLCGAGDGTCVPVLPRCHQSCCTTAGTPGVVLRLLSGCHHHSILASVLVRCDSPFSSAHFLMPNISSLPPRSALEQCSGDIPSHSAH